MTKHIELKRFNQGTALTTGTLALPPLVIEGLAEFNGSFDRLCLKAGTAAIEAMLAADAEQFCGKRYQRHADRQGGGVDLGTVIDGHPGREQGPQLFEGGPQPADPPVGLGLVRQMRKQVGPVAADLVQEAGLTAPLEQKKLPSTT